MGQFGVCLFSLSSHVMKVGWEDFGFIIVVCDTITALYWSLLKSRCTASSLAHSLCVGTEHWVALGKLRICSSGMGEGLLFWCVCVRVHVRVSVCMCAQVYHGKAWMSEHLQESVLPFYSRLADHIQIVGFIGKRPYLLNHLTSLSFGVFNAMY
jgi:hypothetical protein